MPGLVGAQRCRSDTGSGFLAVHQLDSEAALQTSAHRKIKDGPSERTRRMLDNASGFTRDTCRSLGVTEDADAPGAFATASVLYAVGFDVPPSDAGEFDAGEFDDWYAGEPIPLLVGCPIGCRSAVSRGPTGSRSDSRA